MYKRPPLRIYIRRFWERVGNPDRRGCMKWLGHVSSSNGYGQLNFNGEKAWAHRVAFRISAGFFPDGLCVCHRCDNALCVNPRHLFLGTVEDNNHDMARKGRAARGEKNGSAKLNARKVLAIRKSFETGARTAKTYGVSEALVSLIRSQKLWTHL